VQKCAEGTQVVTIDVHDPSHEGVASDRWSAGPFGSIGLPQRPNNREIMSRLSQFIRSIYQSQNESWHQGLLPLHQPDFPVAVCWSAKSGCTTVLKWFLAQNGLLDEAVAYSSWIHEYRQHKLERAAGYRSQCKKLLTHGRNGTSVVKVIRDPATRAVSSFLHVLRASHDVNRWPVAALLSQWKAAAGLERQQGLSFRQFLQFVLEQQLRKTPLDPHLRPQYDSTQDPCVEDYIRLENLTMGLEAVEERYGLPRVNVRDLSESAHNNPPSADHAWPTNVAEFAADYHTLKELGTPPPQAFLDPDTLMCIRSAYWTDYGAYGSHYGAEPAATMRMPTAGGENIGESVDRRLRRAA